VDEDKLMEAALEAGADDVVADEEGGFEVLCDPNAFAASRTRWKPPASRPKWPKSS
jgi:transcriptional/translational regulatory protein YebC/TACO1